MLRTVSRLEIGETRAGADRVAIGGDAPLALVAGPCVIEDEAQVTATCAALRAICGRLSVPLVFKASFDKANRTSLHSFRGPGIDAGLAILERTRARFGVPVTTDVHEPGQAVAAAQVADLLQVPAFLCRQTDLLVACARTGRPVNVKKGQFLSPDSMGHVVAKLVASGACGVMVTERGTSFGYGDLVVDMRALPTIRGLGVPVCFDATHSVQRPAGEGEQTGGRRDLVPHLARAAAAVGVDALFLEVHLDPDRAPSDGATMLPLGDLERVLSAVLAVDGVVRGV